MCRLSATVCRLSAASRDGWGEGEQSGEGRELYVCEDGPSMYRPLSTAGVALF